MPRKATVLAPTGGPVIEIGPTTTRVLAADEDTDGRCSVYEVTVPRRFPGPPAHVHTDRAHAFYVLDGTVQLTIGHETVHASAGTFVYIPPGLAHTFGSAGDARGRLLAFDTPGGWERYLREMASTFPAGTPVDPVRTAQVMARHDTRAAP